MRTISAIFFLLASFVGTPSAVADQPAERMLEGNWRGETKLGTREITFEASFKKDGEWSGVLQILGINSQPLPLQEISVDGDMVAFLLPAKTQVSGETSPGMPARGEGRGATGNGFLFSGRIEKGEIVGTMAVGPMRSAMKMSREN